MLNFSTYNYEDGIMFYNSFLTNKGHKHPMKDNAITIGKIRLVTEKPIDSNEMMFITKSPIVVREHAGDNKKTWYHLINNDTGKRIMLENLKYQLKDIFGETAEDDIEEIVVDIIADVKGVKVKNYGIEVLSNIAKINIKAKPYILDYLYKAGIGSKRASGFGMLEIV